MMRTPNSIVSIVRSRGWAGCLAAGMVVVAMLAVLVGCSDYSIQSYGSQKVQVTVELERPSLMLQQAIGRIELRVIQLSSEEELVNLTLVDTGGVVRTVIDSLPAVETLLFVMTAYPLEISSVPLYQAQQRVSLMPDQVNQITMRMRPIVPMIRVQPRFVSLTTGDAFSVDVRVDNVAALYGLSFRVNYDAFLLQVDSVQSIAGDDAIVVAQPEDSPVSGVGVWAIGVSATQPAEALVDASGGSDLVRLFCQPAFSPPWEVTDTARVWLQVTGGTLADSSDIAQGSIFADDGEVEFIVSEF